VDLSAEDCSRLWCFERDDGKTRALITKPVQDLIRAMEDRFVAKTTMWDARLVTGLSGCGKSVAFALAAAFLKSHGIEVYWFRSGHKFRPEIASLFACRPREAPLAVVFIDQIDQVPGEDVDSVLRIGDRMQKCIVVACGSGNVSFTPSSSDTTEIAPSFEFTPILPLDSFDALFPFGFPARKASSEQVKIWTVRQMLDFRPNSSLDIYWGTNRHFLSISVIQKEIQSKACLISEAWETGKTFFATYMHGFLSTQDSQTFAVLLNQLLFTNHSMEPELDAQYARVFDTRYIWEMRIHSCLFIQAYHQVLQDKLLPSVQIDHFSRVQVARNHNQRVLMERKKRRAEESVEKVTSKKIKES
jgi:hypothetical protein